MNQPQRKFLGRKLRIAGGLFLLVAFLWVVSILLGRVVLEAAVPRVSANFWLGAGIMGVGRYIVLGGDGDEK